MPLNGLQTSNCRKPGGSEPSSGRPLPGSCPPRHLCIPAQCEPCSRLTTPMSAAWLPPTKSGPGHHLGQKATLACRQFAIHLLFTHGTAQPTDPGLACPPPRRADCPRSTLGIICTIEPTHTVANLGSFAHARQDPGVRTKPFNAIPRGSIRPGLGRYALQSLACCSREKIDSPAKVTVHGA